ncbi:MAG: hypothetical protein GQ542_10700 [Desulforhopalus sp.]|nr:hypothetical protein [Desulforhopalus sp.]
MGNDYLLKVPEGIASLIRNLHPLIKADIRVALHFLVQNPNGGKVLTPHKGVLKRVTGVQE